MAPPTPVLDALPETLRDRDCPLKELTQHHCIPELQRIQKGLDIPADAIQRDQFICIPFTRLFRECVDRTIEVTTSSTN
ncbi:hypothetical protein RNJ44_00024 [Nakaseomyces bracarensis]|uniref:Uncharacterized protein n=1 Tax=Nakaseomyces bracarensis TaxID=273131 RepID=A0ABR4P0W1_9SACH